MSKQQTELAGLIESVVGTEYVTTEPALQIDGFAPSILVRPGSSEEVARCLRICADLDAAVIPAGLMSWLECGNRLKRADVVLSLERINRVIDYSPPDLTATVGAGLSLHEFNRVTARERQWLPLDPSGSTTASLGAIAACNSSGALRLGFGTPRDYVIGLKLAHADGTESKSGGRVVKNVAGYDMNKLYVGSFGTLAVITEVTLKLRPLPESFATVVVTGKNQKSLIEFAKRVLASEMMPSSIFLTRRLFTKQFGDDALLLRFIESEAAVRHQLDWVERSVGSDYQSVVMTEAESEVLWKTVADIDARAANAVRISVLVSIASEAFERSLATCQCISAADLGVGIIRMAIDGDGESAIETIKRLRADAISMGGTLFIERAPKVVKQQVDAWGEVGATTSLMQSIKAKFDPETLLNPGRFVAGI
ncbi:MAG: FAD-binding oxidoreductase [Blastocatellia bacterium]